MANTVTHSAVRCASLNLGKGIQSFDSMASVAPQLPSRRSSTLSTNELLQGLTVLDACTFGVINAILREGHVRLEQGASVATEPRTIRQLAPAADNSTYFSGRGGI